MAKKEVILSILREAPEELKGLIKDIRQFALSKGVKAYLVGGFVRDLILKVQNLDLDIVIEGDGIKFASEFLLTQEGKITAHKAFGTATIKLTSGLKIDFSSARKESYPKPAHLPVVCPGSLKDDLFRRDFTINAMAIDLEGGKVIDFFGGLSDLKNKKIRILHNLSFRDDPTRILRGIRFEQRFRFSFEAKTLKLIKEALCLGLLNKVHLHRIRDELILLLKEDYPIRVIKRIAQLTGFTFLHPKLKFKPKELDYLRSLETEIKWFKKNFPKRRSLDTWLIYLIGLLEPFSLKLTTDICKGLGLRNGETKRIITYKQRHLLISRVLSKSKAKPTKIYSLLEPLSYETIIAIRARYKNRLLRKSILSFMEVYNGMCVAVSGDDLRSLGLFPSPKYKEVFSSVLNARLNGRVKNKEEELSLIKRLLKRGD
ncbi:MAG: CCA tRNA nucleotidyltransferase [Candidatus Omnitrophota bacterium]